MTDAAQEVLSDDDRIRMEVGTVRLKTKIDYNGYFGRGANITVPVDVSTINYVLDKPFASNGSSFKKELHVLEYPLLHNVW